ncbi:MAG: peptide deformylase [Chitinophagaceae bacterium]
MVLPIVAYGHPVLREVAQEISENSETLKKLISDMWDTLYATNGVGLAAPQVNKSIRLFIVDTVQIFEDSDPDETATTKGFPGIKKEFINARILELNGEEYSYNEGCLSIPKIREDIVRNEEVVIEYYDAHWQKHEEKFNGINARVILHEYDHIEGKLIIDRMSLLKKKLIKSKLDDISKGKIKVDYRMTFQK